MTCAACFGHATGTQFWREYVVCGDCFADLTAEEMQQRVCPFGGVV